MKINGIEVNAKVTAEVVAEACERYQTTLDNPGFCISCGHEVGGVEPDARRYKCEACGEPHVYGAEELMMEMA
jgi:hypothetical protein